MAKVAGAQVLLRIEDHDRERSRSAYASAILEDLAWLGFAPDAGPMRQSEDPAPYAAAVDRLRDAGLTYACDCTRSTFAAWNTSHRHEWRGPGCPGGCRDRALVEGPSLTVRVALGAVDEAWDDRILGRSVGQTAATGDPAVRDRNGNWTYALCVVVDDHRQAIGLVVRGEDLVAATPAQIRLGRLLGRLEPPAFAHHKLIRKAGGAKLSKADGDSGVRELRAAGWSAADVIGAAANAVGLIPVARPIEAGSVGGLFDGRVSAAAEAGR